MSGGVSECLLACLLGCSLGRGGGDLYEWRDASCFHFANVFHGGVFPRHAAGLLSCC